MKEIVDYILNHFKIKFDDLRPSTKPKPNNIKARIIISVFLKYKKYRNSFVIKNLHTSDTSNIYNLIKKYEANLYPELTLLFEELKEKFDHIEGDKICVIAMKRCGCCNIKKQNNIHFGRYKRGTYRQFCIECEDIKAKLLHEKREVARIKRNEKRRVITKEKVDKPRKNKIKDEVPVIASKKNNNTFLKKKEEPTISLTKARYIQRKKEQSVFQNGGKFKMLNPRTYILSN